LNPAVAPWQRVSVAAVAALILLELLWELWLAPLRPGGSWLALKALPLALLWPGLARGAKRPRQWSITPCRPLPSSTNRIGC
jgi:uncharacterized membrane protein